MISFFLIYCIVLYCIVFLLLSEKDGETAIMKASEKGHLSVVEYLSKLPDIDINSRYEVRYDIA